MLITAPTIARRPARGDVPDRVMDALVPVKAVAAQFAPIRAIAIVRQDVNLIVQTAVRIVALEMDVCLIVRAAVRTVVEAIAIVTAVLNAQAAVTQAATAVQDRALVAAQVVQDFFGKSTGGKYGRYYSLCKQLRLQYRRIISQKSADHQASSEGHN